MPRRRQLPAVSATVNHVLSYAEVLALVKLNRFSFRYVMAGTWCPFKINSLTGSLSQAGYTASASIQLPKRAMVAWLEAAFPSHVRDKIHINVSTSGPFIWVGRFP